MTDLRQAAQQALEALESLQGGCTDHDDGTVEAITVWCPEVIDALRTALEQQAEPPPEWPLIKNILAVFGLDAIAFVAKWQAAQQQAEPVAYLCENAVGHKYFRWKKPSGTYKPIALYTTPPQRQWVGLTDEDCKRMSAGDKLVAMWADRTLKERNGY